MITALRRAGRWLWSLKDYRIVQADDPISGMFREPPAGWRPSPCPYRPDVLCGNPTGRCCPPPPDLTMNAIRATLNAADVAMRCENIPEATRRRVQSSVLYGNPDGPEPPDVNQVRQVTPLHSCAHQASNFMPCRVCGA